MVKYIYKKVENTNLTKLLTVKPAYTQHGKFYNSLKLYTETETKNMNNIEFPTLLWVKYI